MAAAAGIINTVGTLISGGLTTFYRDIYVANSITSLVHFATLPSKVDL
jgi:hypothetical protein